MKLISTPAEVLNQGFALIDLGYGLPPAKVELADLSMTQDTQTSSEK